MSRRKYAVGIDLGTTRCNVGVVYNGISRFLYSKNDKMTDSCVSFTDTDVIVGIDDKDNALNDPTNTVFGIKRILGREPDDPVVRRLKRYVPFKITDREDRTCVRVFYKLEEQYFTPQQITTFLLESLKKKVEALLKSDVREAVISVPGSFTNAQRQATKEAAIAAGFRVLALVTETTATAISYQGGRRRNKGDRQTVAIVDMGGGKLDVSIVTVSDESIDVRAVSGSTEMGGDNLVEMLMDRVFDEYKEKFGKYPPRDPAVMDKLRAHCRIAMQNLTVCEKLTLPADCFEEECKFDLEICKNDYTEWAKAKIRPTLLASLDRVFESSGLRKDNISKVILVGGCTCTEAFRDWLKEYFGLRVDGRNVNTSNAVAEGAAMYAALLSGDSQVREMTVNDLFQNVDSVTSSSATGETSSQP